MAKKTLTFAKDITDSSVEENTNTTEPKIEILAGTAPVEALAGTAPVEALAGEGEYTEPTLADGRTLSEHLRMRLLGYI